MKGDTYLVKDLHTASMVVLPSEREQKRVQGWRWLILKRNWMCTKLSVMRVLSLQRDILLLQSQSTKVAAGIRRSYCEGFLRVVWNACILKGEGNEFTILAGTFYAVEIQKANHGDEARALLTKLLATSKQFLGHQHNTTKEVALALEKLHVSNHGWCPLSQYYSPICRIGLLLSIFLVANSRVTILLEKQWPTTSF